MHHEIEHDQKQHGLHEEGDPEEPLRIQDGMVKPCNDQHGNCKQHTAQRIDGWFQRCIECKDGSYTQAQKEGVEKFIPDEPGWDKCQHGVLYPKSCI